MSLYNALFGRNPASDVILATLGLSRGAVGRFRDAWVEKDNTGEYRIAVYTRNGGGNRECWHEGSGWYASEDCKHESRIAEVDEVVEATDAEAAEHPEWAPRNVFIGAKRQYKTGRKVSETQYRCLEPASEACACPGCTIEYRLPQHPNFLHSQDDDFDCTYATIYFSLPEQYAEDLKAIAEEKPHDPSAAWVTLLDGLQQQAAEGKSP